MLSSTVDRSSGAVKSRWVGQPTDVAILDLLDNFGEDDVRERISARVSETPFSSERKWMGVIIGNGASADGTEVAYIKGALEQVLLRCDTYLTKDGREVILDETRRQAVRQAAEQMAGEGLRVLAFASGAVRDGPRGKRAFGSRSGTPLSAAKPGSTSDDDDRYNGLVFSGLVGMNDPPRKDVHRSIRRLMSGGVRVIMITGDAEATAVAIAKKLGMPVSSTAGTRAVMGGDELDRMSTGELAQAISTTSIFARTSPDHKMKIVRALQSRGDVVAMTGDGVNDAPALKKADIGISMGRLGTDVAKEAADMILTDDDFSTILRAIEQGKGIFYNIQNFITFQLSTSVAALSLVLLSTTLGFKNPLNAMQILWISTLSLPSPPQVMIPGLANKIRYSHGRSTGTISRRRTSRPIRHGPATTPETSTRADQTTHPTRAHPSSSDHARHAGDLRPRDGRRRQHSLGSGQNIPHRHGSRHHNDLHLLCAIRHVQRAQLPQRGQVNPARRDLAHGQQDVQLRSDGFVGRPGLCDLSPRAAEYLPDGTAKLRASGPLTVYLQFGVLGRRREEVLECDEASEVCGRGV